MRTMRWTRALILLTLVGVAISLAGAYVVSVWVRERPDGISFIKKLIDRYGLMGVFAATVVTGTVIPLGAR